MSSLVSIVETRGPIRYGDPDGEDVRTLQLALQQAGSRVADDGVFGPRTDMVVRQFQQQHKLGIDGVVGHATAQLLDAPHPVLLQAAEPLVHAASGWPHDDTASLQGFYGKPWEKSQLLTSVTPPFTVYYGNTPTHSMRVHVKIAAALLQALNEIWSLAGLDPSSSLLNHVRHYDGCYNYRPVRGSSRLSCHAFGAALDFDNVRLPLGHAVPASEMPAEVVNAFLKAGAFWGGNYVGRKDPMHFQWAHE